MASKRDPRYTRTIGKKPHQGRRYVEKGRVRIEWTEDGKRRKRTVGDNTAENRRKADDELRSILATSTTQEAAESPEPEVPAGEGQASPDDSAAENGEAVDIDELLRGVTESARTAAMGIIDAADRVAGWFDEWLARAREDEPADAEEPKSADSDSSKAD